MADPRDIAKKKRIEQQRGGKIDSAGVNGNSSTSPQDQYLRVAKEVGVHLKISDGKQGMHTVCVKRPDESVICTLTLSPKDMEGACRQIRKAAKRPSSIRKRVEERHGIKPPK